MRLESCPLCGGAGTGFATGRLGCNNCGLYAEHADDWNRLARLVRDGRKWRREQREWRREWRKRKGGG